MTVKLLSALRYSKSSCRAGGSIYAALARCLLNQVLIVFRSHQHFEPQTATVFIIVNISLTFHGHIIKIVSSFWLIMCNLLSCVPSNIYSSI